MQDLRVLHISSAMSWRGGEQQISYLVDELLQRGIPQWILCASGSKMEEWCQRAGVDFFTYQKISAINPLVARRIRQICRHTRANVIHTHDSHAHTYAVMAASFFGNKTQLVVHRRVDFPIGKNWLSKWKYNHPAVSAIVCTSKAILEIIKPDIKAHAKLKVVHSGVDFARFGLDGTGKILNRHPIHSDVLRKEFSIAPGHFIIANVAAIAPHKDYFTFVNTAEILIRENFPATFFIIGGDGGEEQQIRHFIMEKKLESHFYLLGHRDDVPRILPGADVLLFTSKTEGIGGATFEAFACGVPVVATAAGGVPEVVEHELCGLLAPVGDAILLAKYVQRVLVELGLKEKLVKNAYQKLSYFSKKRTAKEILDVYISLF